MFGHNDQGYIGFIKKLNKIGCFICCHGFVRNVLLFHRGEEHELASMTGTAMNEPPKSEKERSRKETAQSHHTQNGHHHDADHEHVNGQLPSTESPGDGSIEIHVQGQVETHTPNPNGTQNRYGYGGAGIKRDTLNLPQMPHPRISDTYHVRNSAGPEAIQIEESERSVYEVGVYPPPIDEE